MLANPDFLMNSCMLLDSAATPTPSVPALSVILMPSLLAVPRARLTAHAATLGDVLDVMWSTAKDMTESRRWLASLYSFTGFSSIMLSCTINGSNISSSVNFIGYFIGWVLADSTKISKGRYSFLVNQYLFLERCDR